MKTQTYNTIQKSSFFLALIFFSFSLSSLTAGELTAKKIQNSIVKENPITIKITKKTTLEELENIKKQMKDKGLTFNYFDVVYNENEEIVSISIVYRDRNNNTGNYSVSSETPINNIVIRSNGNQVSVKSEGSGNQASINQGNSNQVSKDNRQNLEERRAAMEKRRDEMDKKMDVHMQEMMESRSKMRAQMEYARDSIFGEERKNTQEFSGNYNVITKNTTNAELREVEKDYEAENIIFSYNQLERNASNLITHISITVNNGKGSISTSNFGNGTDPIKDVMVGVDQVHIIMKSTE